MIFSAVPELRNSGKSAKSCEIQINICWYNILFWNLSLLLGLFDCRELANLSWNFITTTSKQHSKTMSCKLCCEKLGTSHDVKSFAKGSFLERALNALIKSGQNRFLAKFAQKIPTKLAVFYQLFSREVSSENFHESVFENLVKFDFFCDLSEAL